MMAGRRTEGSDRVKVEVAELRARLRELLAQSALAGEVMGEGVKHARERGRHRVVRGGDERVHLPHHLLVGQALLLVLGRSRVGFNCVTQHPREEIKMSNALTKGEKGGKPHSARS
jgi:hypothetical protein